MSHKFLSLVAVGLLTSAFVACGEDDDDDGNADDTTVSSTNSTGGDGTNGGTTRGTNGSGGNGTGGGATNDSTTTRSTSGGAGGTTGTGGASGAGAGGEGDGGMAGMGGAPALTDRQLLHVALTANLGEVEQAEIALMRADASNVVEFAEMMLEDHSEAAEEAEELADAQDLPPQPNDVSEMLEAESEEIIDRLENASDEEFDLVYMNAQVAVHTEVLMLLTDAIPHANNAALESYLMTMSTHVSAHLDSAETIVDTLE